MELKDWEPQKKILQLEAENQRLREALKLISEDECVCDLESGLVLCSICIARRSLEGE